MDYSSSDLSIGSKWERYVDRLNLNNVHKKRTCYVILVVERTAIELDRLLMIRYHSETNIKNEVKFISLNDIYDFIISYETKKLFVHEPIRMLLKRLCHEARHYLKKGDTIPHDLLAKLIKLKIITIITNDVHVHKYPKTQYNEFGTSDESIDFPNFGWTSRGRSNKLIYRQLYIILIQFYSPKIIPACCQCGLSISAIVEFGNRNHSETTPKRSSDIYRQEFWKRAPCLYYRYHLDEPFRLVYNPKSVSMSKDNPKMYAQQCHRLYRGFVSSIDIDKIKQMKDNLITQCGLQQLLKAKIVKNSDSEEETDKQNSVESFCSVKSSGSGWENTKPFVKRVSPELDIDSRKRYTRWSESYC